MALDACDYLVSRLQVDGSYLPEEGWGPESCSYWTESISTLTNAFRLTRDAAYTDAAKRIAEYLRKTQRRSGLWGADHRTDFPIFNRYTSRQQDLQYNLEDEIRGTGFVAMSLANYQDATGDRTYEDVVNYALSGVFREGVPELSHMTPDILLIGIHAWKGFNEEFMQYEKPLLDHMLDTFLPEAPLKHLFFSALRSLALMQTAGLRVLESHIEPAIEMQLKREDILIPGIRGGLIHSGFDPNANIRASGALAFWMRSVDLATGTDRYQSTETYRDLATWIDSQKDPQGGFFEVQKAEDFKRLGKGSPGQYIPCWWIFGTM